MFFSSPEIVTECFVAPTLWVKCFEKNHEKGELARVKLELESRSVKMKLCVCSVSLVK